MGVVSITAKICFEIFINNSVSMGAGRVDKIMFSVGNTVIIFLSVLTRKLEFFIFF